MLLLIVAPKVFRHLDPSEIFNPIPREKQKQKTPPNTHTQKQTQNWSGGCNSNSNNWSLVILCNIQYMAQ